MTTKTAPSSAAVPATRKRIDLCAAVGAGFGPYRMGDDESIMSVISSSLIACGFHAGDPTLMDKAVRLSLARRIDIGARVGFPDMMGFGRRPMQASPQDIARYVAYQIGALEGIAKAAGGRMTQVSLHGALDNMASASEELADAIVQTVAAYDDRLILRVTISSEIERAANRHGMRTVITFLPQRAYDNTLRLMPRNQQFATIDAPATVIERVQQFLRDGTITTATGQRLPSNANSIMVQSDSPGAVNLARIIRGIIENDGGEVKPLSSPP